MGKKRLDTTRGVKKVSQTSFQLEFTYKGETWRPRIKVSNTDDSRDIQYANNYYAEIVRKISRNEFDPIKEFPHYSKTERIVKTIVENTLTIEKLLRMYFQSKPVQALQSSTQDINWRKVKGSLIPRLGHYPAHTLNRVQITEAMVENRERKVTNKTIKNELSILRTAFAWYMEKDNTFDNWCLMDKNGNAWNPASDIRKDHDEIDPFTHEEINELFNACEKAFTKHIAEQIRNPNVVMYWQGLRISECYGLRWEDIDFKNNTIKIHAALVEGKYQDRTKTKNGMREVKMLGETRKALINQKAYTFLQNGFVFVDPANGKPFKKSSYVNRYWKKLFRFVDIRYRPAKQLRHSWASYALASGENEQWISNQLGHGTPSFTRDTYFRFIPDLYVDAGTKIEQLREYKIKEENN